MCGLIISHLKIVPTRTACGPCSSDSFFRNPKCQLYRSQLFEFQTTLLINTVFSYKPLNFLYTYIKILTFGFTLGMTCWSWFSRFEELWWCSIKYQVLWDCEATVRLMSSHQYRIIIRLRTSLHFPQTTCGGKVLYALNSRAVYFDPHPPAMTALLPLP